MLYAFQNKKLNNYLMDLIPLYIEALEQRKEAGAPVETFGNFLHEHDFDAYCRTSKSLLDEVSKEAWERYNNFLEQKYGYE